MFDPKTPRSRDAKDDLPETIQHDLGAEEHEGTVIGSDADQRIAVPYPPPADTDAPVTPPKEKTPDTIREDMEQ
ncbi:MAG: hypothetical protein SF162_07765 [bacterium]|nr:hypothetical protein [bacterium]